MPLLMLNVTGNVLPTATVSKHWELYALLHVERISLGVDIPVAANVYVTPLAIFLKPSFTLIS